MRPWDICDLALPAGRQLRVRTWPGSGRPLVLLHGLLDDSEGWEQLAATTHRPCVAVDLPGFGGSDRPTRPRISAYAEDVRDGLAELGLGPCTVVGHSLGGAVAVSLAERSPDVRSLALLAPAGFGPIRLAEFMTLPGVVDVAHTALPFALVSPLLVTAGYAAFVAHGRMPPKDVTERRRRRAFQSGPGVRDATTAIAVAGRSPNAFFRRPIDFDGPVAALWGERDALVPPTHARALLVALPQARVDVWRGMGHHPQRERSRDLARYVERHAIRPHRRSNAA